MEEGRRVGFELLQAQSAVVIGVRTAEPRVHRIGAGGPTPEGLPGGADEDVERGPGRQRSLGGGGAGPQECAPRQGQKPDVHGPKYPKLREGEA